MTQEKDANALIDEAAQKPTLDEFMRRDPRSFTATDWPRLVEALREDRQRFMRAEKKKREGDDDVDEGTD